MSVDRFGVWRALGAYRTPLVEEAETRLFSILEKLQKDRLSGVLEKPLSHTRNRIFESVVGELLSEHEQATEKNEAIKSCIVHLLDEALDRIHKVPAETSTRRVLLSVDSGFPYAHHFFHPEPHVVAEVFRRLDQKTRHSDRATADTDDIPAVHPHALGIAVTLLVARSGLCSVDAVLDVLEALGNGTPISVANGVSWLTVDMALPSGRQRRRVLMDATCLAGCVAARTVLFPGQGTQGEGATDVMPSSASKASVQRDSGPRRHELKRKVLSSFDTMIDWLWEDDVDSGGIRPEGLPDLMCAASTLINLHSCSLISAYAIGHIASTSLHEDTHCALLNVEALSRSSIAEAAFAAIPSDADAPIGYDALAGDFSANGLSAEIRSCTPRSGSVDVEGLVRIRDAQEPDSTALWIVSWIHHLATDRLARKGKKRAAGTVNLYRSSLVERLLNTLPQQLDGLGPDDFFDLSMDVVETAKTPAQRTRLLERLSLFQRFLVDNKVISGGSPRASGEEAAHYEVSARIISKQSYQAALKALSSDDCLHADRRLALEALCFFILSYRFGLRRAESLGLTIVDLGEGRTDHFLKITKNALRSLKTANARRHLPLSLLSKRERSLILELVEIAKEEGGDRPPEEIYPFFKAPPPHVKGELDSAAVGLALEAVRLGGQDRALRIHHLRHSFATGMLLGELATTLSPGAFARLPNWIKSFRSGAKTFHTHCRAGIGTLTNRLTVVSAALGHGSDQTTLQSYVHGLEWFPFTILRALKEQGGSDALAFISKRSAFAENRLITLLLGLSKHSRFRHGRGEKARFIGVGRHAQLAGLSVNFPVAVERTRNRVPTLLEALSALDSKDDVDGRPTDAASRLFAETFLRSLDSLPPASLTECLESNQRLSRHHISSGWALTSTAVAAGEHAVLRAHAGGLFRIEIRSIHYDGKKRIKKTLKDSEVDVWRKTARGKAEARLSLPEGKGTGQRQRHFRTMSWCLQAVMHWGELPTI